MIPAMSYAAISRDQYSVLFPQSAMHAGSLGWKKSPIPTWGENPLLAGPVMLGETRTAAEQLRWEEGQGIAFKAASQAANEAAVSASVAHAVNLEESKIVPDPSITAMRAGLTEKSIWPYLAIGGAGVLGIGLIVYAMRSNHG